MSTLKINLLQTEAFQAPNEPAARPAHKAPRAPRRWRWPAGFAVAFVLAFAAGRFSLTSPALATIGSYADVPALAQIRHLIVSPDKLLRGEENDRVTVLLLGMGGEENDAPFLTDTIMVASFKPSTKDVALLSIPRDLLVPLPDRGWRKINSVNAFGETGESGEGGEYAREVVQSLLGIEIPYYVRIDFQGFRDIIDAVGGVDVYVDRSFTDATYPTSNHGVETISFAKGWNHLGGETALKFARSRHGNAGEGTDFARAKRQQKVMLALKEKLMTLGTYRNPATIANLVASLRGNVRTNLQLGEMVRLVRYGQDLGELAVRHQVIDNGPQSPLVEGTYGGAYVLLPRNDDWTQLQNAAKDAFTSAPLATDPAPPAPKPADTPATGRIEIQNGTDKSGLARTAATKMAGSGFEVIKIGNAASAGTVKTIVEDYSGTAAGASAASALAAKLGTNLGISTPKVIARKAESNDKRTAAVDFLVILGEDALN
jgi:LCP family protein required for cell wall assembly